MEKKIGLETPKRVDPEERIRSQIRDFRVYIKNLATQRKDPDLQAINTEDLSEEDMIFFQHFQAGTFHIEDIERQERVLANLKEADSARKLLAYMKKRLILQERMIG